MSIQCPSCGNEIVTSHGPIPSDNVFSGQTLTKPINGGELYECSNCFLFFRFPRLSTSELNELYKGGIAENWHSNIETRLDWQLTINYINKIETGTNILDVGCFDGGFLSNLNGYNRYGIEIHPEACTSAEKKGLIILAANISEISELKNNFDIVTALDVIEHVDDPYKFLESLINIVKPGGYLLVTTGDTDCFSWKLMRSRYYYCTIPEHISFINRRWLAWVESRLPCYLVEVINFSHSNLSLIDNTSQFGKNLLYKLFPSISAYLRCHGVGDKDIATFPDLANIPPGWTAANDHILCVLKKV